MQVLYSVEHGNIATPAEALNILHKNIKKAHALLLFDFSLLVRITDFIKIESEIKTSKFLPTEEDLHFSVKLLNNPIIITLRANTKIREMLKHAMNEEETTLVKNIFKNLADNDEYRKYCVSKDADLKSDREIVSIIFNKVALKNPLYEQHIEDNFPECLSELGKLSYTVTEILEKVSPDNPEGLFETSEPKMEEDFAKELLEKTLANEERFTHIIQPKLKNWDLDRIAHLDMLLMKMALCELMFFDQIPVKVTINEYIDISKTYSTPRSKDFINGVLDSIMHEMRERNEIKKTGRGLVE